MPLVPIVAAAPQAPSVWRLSEEYVLGTSANFIVSAVQRDDAAAAISAARAEIERLNGVFNSRRPASELSVLNRSTVMAVSEDLFTVLHQAEAARSLSGGAYSPTLGRVIDLWAAADQAPPDPAVLRRAANHAATRAFLDARTRMVMRPEGAAFALDSIAKGYIVDRALAAGLAAAPLARGMLVDIGGEMRCAGIGADGPAWPVGVSDPSLPYFNAPVVADVRLRDQAIATSGRGPRDLRIGDRVYSATFDPATGQAAARNIGATVVAPSAMQADAMATALLVMPAHEGLALAERTPEVEARITSAGGGVHVTSGWPALARERPARLVRVADTKPDPNRWIGDWVVELNYQAPNKRQDNAPDFRSPYMALWITDKAGRPVRTIMLVGPNPKYQEDNYIWWSLYRDQAPKLVELRANATSLSGKYPLYWPGYDDSWKFVPLGEYVLHVETSQEHGKHTYRTMPLVLGHNGFKAAMPATKEGGGLEIVYGKRD